MATLSASHRERVFTFTGSGDMQEQAWKSCWRLCQKLYETRDEDHASQAKATLELCRDFCQALFEARERGDEIKDSVLRVSFELNNHLYNTQNPNSSPAVTERTLDFYLTICHRLMKDSTALPEETDHLVRSCWGLAECLFGLRQSNGGMHSEEQEELLSSAVEACLELTDLFREGWSLLRPDRGTPRAMQRQFAPSNAYSSTYGNTSSYQPSHPTSRPPSSLSYDGGYRQQPFRNFVPETPTTIYDDREDVSSPVPSALPYIEVMNADRPPSALQVRQSQPPRWSSNNSVSGYSESSNRTASSRTTRGGVESSQTSPKSVTSASAHPSSSASATDDPNIVRIKALILKVAMNKGFSRSTTAVTASSSTGNGSAATSPSSTLQTFVRALPSTALGTLPWQVSLFDSYRKLVLHDPGLQDMHGFPRGRRFTPGEIARAVRRLAGTEAYGWLPALFEVVFGFDVDDVGVNKAPGLQV
jgi:hypothetical protein